jgi:predicted transcriptional regulator
MKKLNQSQIAKKHGVSSSYVNNVINHRRHCKNKELVADIKANIDHFWQPLKSTKKALEDLVKAINDLIEDGRDSARIGMRHRQWKIEQEDGKEILIFPNGAGVVFRLSNAIDAAEKALKEKS